MTVTRQLTHNHESSLKECQQFFLSHSMDFSHSRVVNFLLGRLKTGNCFILPYFWSKNCQFHLPSSQLRLMGGEGVETENLSMFPKLHDLNYDMEGAWISWHVSLTAGSTSILGCTSFILESAETFTYLGILKIFVTNLYKNNLLLRYGY